MNKKEETATITMTEAQLERVIKTAIKTALRDLKEEDELPGNEVDELQAAPITFSLLGLIPVIFLSLIISISILFIIMCGKIMFQSGFSFGIFLFGAAFLFIGILAFVSMCEINKTKKIEVINTMLNATVSLSSLIVAIIGAYFAYKALK